MINEVGNLIIENKDISISEKENTFLLYKEIWKFIFDNLNVDFEKINIKFNLYYQSSSYFIQDDERNGIKYNLISNGTILTKEVNSESVDLDKPYFIFNKSIDKRLLLKLFSLDNFYINCLDDCSPVIIYLESYKNNILRIINDILVKNNILSLKKLVPYDRIY